MRISDYRFGKIVIDNRTYTRDVIICGRDIIGNWWRKQGHRIELGDLDRVELTAGIHLIIGTGYNDCVVLDPDLVEYCRSNDVKLESMPTPLAVRHFNSLSGEPSVIGAFHLTC